MKGETRKVAARRVKRLGVTPTTRVGWTSHQALARPPEVEGKRKRRTEDGFKKWVKKSVMDAGMLLCCCYCRCYCSSADGGVDQSTRYQGGWKRNYVSTVLGGSSRLLQRSGKGGVMLAFAGVVRERLVGGRRIAREDGR